LFEDGESTAIVPGGGVAAMVIRPRGAPVDVFVVEVRVALCDEIREEVRVGYAREGRLCPS